MKAVIQRVSSASVSIEDEEVARIKDGLLILLGISQEDDTQDVVWLARKTAALRIFQDEAGEKMDRSVVDIEGEVLVVSQFTLHARVKKGTRPGFDKAARPEKAVPLYELFIEELGSYLKSPVQTGRFGSMMEVSLVNDGPVTIVIDTEHLE